MWKRLGGLWLVLMVLVMAIPAMAAETANGPVVVPAGANGGGAQSTDTLVQAQTDAANRFLSAEVSRQIKAEGDAIQQNLRDYQDENFQELDKRMFALEERMRQKLILGGVGAMLVASGIVALVYMWAARKYSMETYQKQVSDKLTKELEVERARNAKGIDALQQRDWEVPSTPVNVTAQMGISQDQAADLSHFNEWQHEPIYQGAWTPPDEYTQNNAPQQYDPNQYNQGYDQNNQNWGR